MPLDVRGQTETFYEKPQSLPRTKPITRRLQPERHDRRLIATSAVNVVAISPASTSDAYFLRPSNGLSGNISEGVRTSLIIFANRATTAGLSAATSFLSLMSSLML